MEDLFPQNLTLENTKQFQENLAESLVLQDDFSKDFNTIGAAALHTRGEFITVSAAIFNTDSDFKKFEIADERVVREKAQFPAVPGFESFRDGAILTKILRGFTKPSLFFIQGDGINHPRKLGLASHVGLALDIPTIGISRDVGSGFIKTVSGKDVIFENQEIRGAVIKKGRLKIYVAPGHKISWETALDLTKKCTRSIFPEPLF